MKTLEIFRLATGELVIAKCVGAVTEHGLDDSTPLNMTDEFEFETPLVLVHTPQGGLAAAPFVPWVAPTLTGKVRFAAGAISALIDKTGADELLNMYLRATSRIEVASARPAFQIVN